MFNDDTRMAMPDPRQFQPTQALPEEREAKRKPARAPRQLRDQIPSDFPWSDPTMIAVNNYRRLAPAQQEMLRLHQPMARLPWGLAIGASTLLAGGAAFYLRRWEVLLLPVILLLIFAVRWLTLRAQHHRIVQVAEQGMIEHAQGEVHLQGHTRVAHTANRQIKTIHSQILLPPPGHYRFFYVSEGGILLSAQPLAPGNASSSSAAPAAVQSQPRWIALMNALSSGNGFKPEDVDANRSGILSPRQRKMLAHHRTWAALGCTLFALVGCILIVGSGMLALPSTIPQVSDPNLQWAPLLFAAFALLIALWYGSVARKYARDRREGRATHITGQVKRSEKTTKNGRGKQIGSSYTYTLDKLSFRVSAAAHNALVEGLPYRLYYTPRTKRLLSLEPLEAPRW